jgi:hypothetical protein
MSIDRSSSRIQLEADDNDIAIDIRYRIDIEM